jgi:hypothetical protein
MTVPLRVTLIVACVLNAGPLCAQTAFKYKFKAGDTFRYDLTIGQKGITKVDDKEFGGEQQQIITMTWKVESVDDKGAAKIRLKVDRVKVAAEANKKRIEASSDDKAEPADKMAKPLYVLAKALSKFEGTFTMTEHGDIKNATIPPEIVKAMKSVPGAEDTDAMSEKGFEATLTNNTFVLPNEAITKGKSWKEKAEGTMPGSGKYAGDVVFTYEGDVTHAGLTVARFTIKSEFKIEPEAKAKGAALKNVEWRGTCFFDAAAGQMIEFSAAQTMEFAGENEGKKFVQRLESSNGLKRLK